MRLFTNGILIIIVAIALCGGCVKYVGLDVRVKTAPPQQVPKTYFTVKFETTSYKHLCGGTVSVTAFPGTDDQNPPTLDYDIRDGEARIRVPRGTRFAVLRVAYPYMNFKPDSVGIHDTTLVMAIGGGC